MVVYDISIRLPDSRLPPYPTAVKRLMREAMELKDPTPMYFAQPLEVRRHVQARIDVDSCSYTHTGQSV